MACAILCLKTFNWRPDACCGLGMNIGIDGSKAAKAAFEITLLNLASKIHLVVQTSFGFGGEITRIMLIGISRTAVTLAIPSDACESTISGTRQLSR